jgi:hypothetical protein
VTANEGAGAAASAPNLAERINNTSLDVGRAILDLARIFKHREAYRPLDELALEVQNLIVAAGCAASHAEAEASEASARQVAGEHWDEQLRQRWQLWDKP